MIKGKLFGIGVFVLFLLIMGHKLETEKDTNMEEKGKESVINKTKISEEKGKERKLGKMAMAGAVAGGAAMTMLLGNKKEKELFQLKHKYRSQ